MGLESSSTVESLELPLQLEDPSCLPSYATELAAGADLKAFLPTPLTLQPGERCLVPTGVRVAIPAGYEVQIRPRSGLAAKQGVTVLNSPGTIDADYRGQIYIILINLGEEPFTITSGMRIAQMVLAPVLRAQFILEEDLGTTQRGEGRFGHTGSH